MSIGPSKLLALPRRRNYGEKNQKYYFALLKLLFLHFFLLFFGGIKKYRRVRNFQPITRKFRSISAGKTRSDTEEGNILG